MASDKRCHYDVFLLTLQYGKFQSVLQGFHRFSKILQIWVSRKMLTKNSVHPILLTFTPPSTKPLACHAHVFVNKAPFWNVNIVIC